jgi:hypothetical protein
MVALVSAAAEPAAIHLRSARIEPGAAAIGVPDALQAQGEGLRLALVQFPGPVTEAQRAALEAAVERVYTYLPDDAFLVKLVAGEDLAADGGAGLQIALGARFVGPYHPAYKLAPAIAEMVDDPAAKEGSEPMRIVMVHLFPDADLTAVRNQIKDSLGVPGMVGAGPAGRFGRLRLLLTASEIARFRDDLATLPEVFWIDLEGRRELLNDTTISVGQAGVGAGGATPIFSRGIFGEGQIIGVLDTGIDPDMCFFRDPARGLPPINACNSGTVVNNAQRKVIAVDFLWSNECNGGIAANEWDTQDHGTHVAGIAAGDNFANPLLHNTADGMAPGAKLVIQDCGFQTNNCADCPGIGCPVVDLVPIFLQAFNQGARIHTNSWGDRENFTPRNIYSAGSEDADQVMWNNKDYLLLFAAGNNGPGNNTVLSPSTAKNVVAVGATQRNTAAESMASFSSCGPTADGRIKPDITVPGQGIVSANSDNNTGTNNCNTLTLSGTSMASPGAAGFAALIRQYYTDGFYPTGSRVTGNGFTPSAALLKATLVNSGRDMVNAGDIPANCQGWGRVTVDDALFFPGDTRNLFVVDDRTGFPQGSSGATRIFDLTVGGGQTFKVTLTWTDFPSTPAAAVNLVNDLDLTVSGPGGTFLGNVFSAGRSVSGGSADRRNTVEQVLIPAAAAGTYRVTVRSQTVPQGPQPFALVVTGNNVSQGGGGPCTTPPQFAGVSQAVDTETASCGVRLTWNAAQSQCPEGPSVTYTVFRSTTPAFTPSAANRIATCVTGTSFTDATATFGQDFFYIVRAEDSTTGNGGACNGGNLDGNGVVASASPTGGRTILHQATFEGGAGGWAHDAATSTCATGAWVVGNPTLVTNGGVVTQLEDDHTPAPGVNALFTAANTSAGVDDVDGGVCTALSPVVNATGFARAQVSLWIFHGQRDGGGDPNGDFFRVHLSNDGGASFPTTLINFGDTTRNAVWTEVTTTVTNPGQLRLRVQASDGPATGDLIEGGVDDVLIEGTAACTTP